MDGIMAQTVSWGDPAHPLQCTLLFGVAEDPSLPLPTASFLGRPLAEWMALAGPLRRLLPWTVRGGGRGCLRNRSGSPSGADQP